MSDKCRDLRDVYETCFRKWFDEEYLAGKEFGGERFVPCEHQLNDYHECIRTDKDKAKYLNNLDKLKELNK